MLYSARGVLHVTLQRVVIHNLRRGPTAVAAAPAAAVVAWRLRPHDQFQPSDIRGLASGCGQRQDGAAPTTTTPTSHGTYSTSTQRASCWHCGQQAVDSIRAGGLFCGHCGAVQPPCASCDFFSFFSCPRDFTINESNLSVTYKQLQWKLHPDRAMSSSHVSPQAQQFSASQSALINDAYHTLRDPYRRAAYLLKSLGIDLESEEANAYANNDPTLLLRVMDMRERIEDAQRISELTTIVQATQDEMRAILPQLAGAFKRSDLPRAAQLAVSLKYLTKIKEEADARIDRLHETARLSSSPS